MAGARLTYGEFAVRLAGVPLSGDLEHALMSIVVEQSLVQPDLLVLELVDSSASAQVSGVFRIGARIQVDASTGNDNDPQLALFDGDVASIEAEYDAGLANRILVRAYDQSYRMTRGVRTEAYVNMTYDDVVKKVAQRHQITIGQVDAVPPVHPQVAQAAVDDWTFLRRLADEVGYDLYVALGKLQFRKPVSASGGPPPGQLDGDDVRQVVRGMDGLVRLRATVTGSDQVTRTVFRGWNPVQKKEVVGEHQPATVTASIPNQDPAGVAALLPGAAPVHETGAANVADATRAANIAAAVAAELAGSFVEVDAELAGMHPRITAGELVSLAEFDPVVDGKYRISSARHEWSPALGYRTAFGVADRRNRSMLGLVDGSRLAGSGGFASGLVPAIVDSVDVTQDKDKLHRVKLHFPWLSSSYVSDWARVVQVGAGASRGLFVLPEVNDEVLVGFEHGDFNRPYVVGGLYNGSDKPFVAAAQQVKNGKVVQRGFVSRTGQRIVLGDDDQKHLQSITLATGDGKVTVTVGGRQGLNVDVQDNRRVVVTTKGAVDVTADGDVTVKGQKNVAVQATGDVDLSGANVTVEASADLTLKGATVKVEASGPTQVKGNPIKLN